MILTSHAKARLRERGITESQVKSVLEAPNISYAHKLKGREVMVKSIRGQRLKIVVARKDENVFLITAVRVGERKSP